MSKTLGLGSYPIIIDYYHFDTSFRFGISFCDQSGNLKGLDNISFSCFIICLALNPLPNRQACSNSTLNAASSISNNSLNFLLNYSTSLLFGLLGNGEPNFHPFIPV